MLHFWSSRLAIAAKTRKRWDLDLARATKKTLTARWLSLQSQHWTLPLWSVPGDVKNFGNKRTSKLGASYFTAPYGHTLKKRPRLQYIKIQLIQFPLHQGTEVSLWPQVPGKKTQDPFTSHLSDWLLQGSFVLFCSLSFEKLTPRGRLINKDLAKCSPPFFSDIYLLAAGERRMRSATSCNFGSCSGASSKQT